jgi:hypothetical protein
MFCRRTVCHLSQRPLKRIVAGLVETGPFDPTSRIPQYHDPARRMSQRRQNPPLPLHRGRCRYVGSLANTLWKYRSRMIVTGFQAGADPQIHGAGLPIHHECRAGGSGGQEPDGTLPLRPQRTKNPVGRSLPFFRCLPRQPAHQKKCPRPEMHPPPLSSSIPTHAPPPRNSWYAEFRVSSTQG